MPDDPISIPRGTRKTEFDTGAVRDTAQGKGLPSSIPPSAIRSLAERYEAGAKLYDRENWLKGIPLSRLYDAILRHSMAAHEGDTSEDHLGAILWNTAAWIEIEKRIADGRLPGSLDDLPFRLYDQP